MTVRGGATVGAEFGGEASFSGEAALALSADGSGLFRASSLLGPPAPNRTSTVRTARAQTAIPLNAPVRLDKTLLYGQASIVAFCALYKLLMGCCIDGHLLSAVYAQAQPPS